MRCSVVLFIGISTIIKVSYCTKPINISIALIDIPMVNLSGPRILIRCCVWIKLILLLIYPATKFFYIQRKNCKEMENSPWQVNRGYHIICLNII